MGRGRGKSLHTTFYYQSAYLTGFILCPYNSHLREGSIADPHFTAVQNYMISLILNIAEHPAGIRSMVRLSKTKTTQPLTRSQLWKKFSSHFLGTIRMNRKHYQRTLNRSCGTNPAISSLQFLHH